MRTVRKGSVEPPAGFAALAVLALLLAGCGSSSEFDGSHPDYEKALAGSPPPLAALHAQANELLPNENGAYEKRIEALRGFPIVVNAWASWCGPCRLEFPSVQNLSAKYGKRVAFLGINSEDSDGFAERFLEEAPVPFPSYTDPDKSLVEELAGRGFPDTIYYTRTGEICDVRQGQYPDEASMEADVKRHALREEGCESA